MEGGVLTSGDINESGVINTTIGNNFELSGSLRVFETKDFNLSLGSNGYHIEISAGSFTYYAESNYTSFEQGMTGTVGLTSFGFYSSYTPNWVNLGLSVAFAATGAHTIRVLPYATKVVLQWAK